MVNKIDYVVFMSSFSVIMFFFLNFICNVQFGHLQLIKLLYNYFNKRPEGFFPYLSNLISICLNVLVQ